MTEKRIKFNNIISNQLPAYVREEFPLVVEFLKQYYISQEFQSAPTDIIQNIDQYIKLDNIKLNAESTNLGADISFLDETIPASSTIGFPNSYGLLMIDDEIITYTGKTDSSFVGCIRGFSGVSSYGNQQNDLVFTTSESADHTRLNLDGTNNVIINLSSLFLKQFFTKIKYQLTPGFEDRDFYPDFNKYLFLKQSKDFYSTRGTDLSFKILFKALYGEEVKIVKPKDYLIKSSGAQYQITNDLIVESIQGDPNNLERSTLFQDPYDYAGITKAYAPISKVEKIFTKTDKEYYKLSFDAGYNKDISVDGSLYGNFKNHPKTKVVGDIYPQSTTIDVDSTVGFPDQGSLSVVYTDGSIGTISYSSKNLTQFFGCQNIIGTVLDSSDIFLDVYAYGVSNQNDGETIKVRITAVLKDVDIEDSYYYNKDDTAIVKTLGVDADDFISNNWFFNNQIIFEVDNIAVSNIADKVYTVKTKIPHNLKIGDNVVVISNDDISVNTFVNSIESKTDIKVKADEQIILGKKYTLKRILSKVKSQKYPTLLNQVANIQNVYKDKNTDKTLVSSTSLPFYLNKPIDVSDRKIAFSGTFISVDIPDNPGFTNSIKISSNGHGFYTGDSVYYTPASKKDSLFEEGLYYVQRVDPNTVRFAKSRSNLYKSIFVDFQNPVTLINNSIIEPFNFHQKTLESQKILREISSPENDGIEYATVPGTTGILINGVEILNYKSNDIIYYGPVQSIDVISSGSNYDIINPPLLSIEDEVGIGASGYCSVSGSLKEIRIIDPGFDYLENPKINISGGNGFGAKVSTSLKGVDYQISFSSGSDSVNISNNTIGFSTYHKLRNAERIIYKTDSQKAIGGISTDSTYYISSKDLYTIRLHKSFEEASLGINTIPLTSYGTGNHRLISYNKKYVLSSINVEDSGYGYENKKRTVTSSGISTSLGQITIKNHKFESGEIIKYSTNGTPIGGLANDTEYYVTKIDENTFKVSNISNVENTTKDFYYQTNQYINFITSGSGTHIFNYPPIAVEIVGNTGIGNTINDPFKAVLQPIFRGEITSVHLDNNGVGYGSSEILNFNREPLVILDSGSTGEVLPIVNNGKIVDILVKNPGKNYISPPDLDIITNGSGSGAILTPIVENGKIKAVNIIEGGFGYEQNSTSINVISAGIDAKFKSNITRWTINLVERYFNSIGSDDGFMYFNPNSKYGLQYTHLYAPRPLRESLYSIEFDGSVIYGKQDLKKDSNNSEIKSNKHSPIIGWAYDGNPIYGPYGYSKKDGGTIQKMSSGYTKITSSQNDRPPLTVFPSGFFVEDYEYRNSDNDSVLDENNGRFCKTPEFPNGTYAYFASVDSVASGSFDGYYLPTFPYLIGNKFKSKPNEFNFKRGSNQDDIDLNQSNWLRNTKQLNLLKDYSSYPYILLPNDLNQTVTVKYASPGLVEGIKIISGGTDYQVNDKIIFDDKKTGGYGFSSKVSKIKGKTISNVSIASTTIYNSKIYPDQKNKGFFIVETDSPHNFSNQDVVSISGLNTTSSPFNGLYPIKVNINTFALSDPAGVGETSVTGIITYFSVSGNIAYSNIKENDIFVLGEEKIKILNIDKKSSRIRVLRCADGTVGSSHSYSDVLYEVPRRFSINQENSKFKLGDFGVNKEIYFIPKESLGIGATSGVGIGTTIFFANPGAGITQIFIPSRTIYIPNHNLNTGDLLTYTTPANSGIFVSSNGTNSFILQNQSKVYVAKISNDLIGISTVKVGLNSTGTFVGVASTASSIGTLYFTGIGTGQYHSFKTNYQVLSGQISRNKVTVSTAQTHGLLNGDDILVRVNTGISTTFVIKYDDYNRKVLVNPRNFLSTDVSVVENTIRIKDHNFETGQKIIHTSITPCGGLINNKNYYVINYDKDTIKLSSSYYNAKELSLNDVDITSASLGTLSPVNPPIKIFRNSSITFDLSDSSLSYLDGSEKYSAFEFNFYTDSNFKNTFDTSKITESFEVQRYGQVGISSNASVTLNVTNNIPELLYYNLVPIYGRFLPVSKNQISTDFSVSLNNQIKIVDSAISGNHNIVSTSSSSFTYTIEKTPESLSYGSEVEYDTTSQMAYGSISEVKITSNGANYFSLPDFSTIISSIGKNAILESYSTSIGNIKKTKINDIGYDFPSDFTLKPNLSLPSILKIDPLNSIDYIDVIRPGKDYLSAPKLLVFDGKTKELLPEVDLLYSLEKNAVTVLANTYRLNEVEPVIIPTENSNGVGINTISYNPITNDVTITLSVGFSTDSSFPFEIGDNILIENVNITPDSVGKGFNSENYDYKLFTLTGVDSNIGGNGSITYSLNGLLGPDEVPGVYDAINSSGRVIPQKYFPVFKTIIKSNIFFKDENLRYVNEDLNIGTVQNWNRDIKQLKVSSRENIILGKTIEGTSSKTRGVVSKVIKFDSFIDIGPYSKVEKGWFDNNGFLNDNMQRIQDNFYYQNFSYSLKSRVPYDTWENAVGSLNHTAGFKKFSDYQLETSGYCGIKTDAITVTDSFTDIIGVVDLNSVYDFDLARENAINVGNRLLSDEITFNSRILTDYFESVGNRVLTVDDFSKSFDSNPRSTKFSVVNRFLLDDLRSHKYITCVRDRRFKNKKQLCLFTLLHNTNTGYLNQYGRIETHSDLGSFDFSSNGYEGSILFYPTNYSENNYNITTLSYNLKENFSGISTTSLGDIVTLETNTTFVSSGSTSIVSFASTMCTSAKILVEVSSDDGDYQFNELNLVTDGAEAYLLEYGELVNPNSVSGLGTYYAYISGSDIVVDFIANVGVAASVSTFAIKIANTTASISGISTFDMQYSKFEAKSTFVTANSPATTISEFPNDYDGGYFLVQVSDTPNNNFQISEVIVVSNDDDSYCVEFANVESNLGLGTMSTSKGPNSTSLMFTPAPDLDLDVKVYANFIGFSENDNLPKEYFNNSILTDYGIYYATDTYRKNYFDLYHKKYPIFKKYFNASDSSIVDIQKNVITIPNHFFVTGEKVLYSTSSKDNIFEVNSPIGIATTDFGPGIGVTDKLASSVYIVKVDENNIKLARSSEDALKTKPNVVTISSVGIGSTHSFTSLKRNERSLITIDSIIQTPITSTATTTKLVNRLSKFEDVLFVENNIPFFVGDIIKIDDEIIKIQSVGVDSSNSIEVLRSWMGTNLVGHSTDSIVMKISGNYNIEENAIFFDSPPYGNVPISSTTNPPNEIDWQDISTLSSFQGRVFLRNALKDTPDNPYNKNYIFDDISDQFDGYQNTFTLKSGGNDVTGIYDKNAIISINNVIQYPGVENNYTTSESGATTISFNDDGISVPSDVNVSDLPRGKIILSVGSTGGFGYQPLVCAGGTAIVSAAGTISSISIGNSGSGYRNYIHTPDGLDQNIVKVGVALSSVGVPSIQYIGTAIVSNGNIVSIAITNPGIGYTRTNPPKVIIDNPLPYSNIPLYYSSTPGIGTYARVDIVVGQNSSVIDFTIKNSGFGYNVGDVLTVPIGGMAGIPTSPNTTISQFEITVQTNFSDKFSGWFLGEFQDLDDISYLFNGKKVIFPLSYQSDVVSLYAAKGSLIDIQNVILVFVNDILQVPGEGYIFKGGSVIEFTEPPKAGDKCHILFYKGSGDDIDVFFKNTTETVKSGDNLQLTYDNSIGQSPGLLEDPRTVTLIKAADRVATNPYFGPGNTPLSSLSRPIIWSRQTDDKIIDGNEVGKDRILYEPSIYPSTYIIKSVGIGSTVIFVENLRPFFNPANESLTSLQFQKNVTFVSPDCLVSASATAIVSVAGTISSIQINNGGSGYLTAPEVTIQNPIGVASTSMKATSFITAGIVTSIKVTGIVTGYSQDNPPVVLIEPPTFDVEKNPVKAYYGDFGFISGISTTDIGVGSTGLIFDFVIARDSYLRSSSVTNGGGISVSGIETGSYFVISNSNVGKGLTSLSYSGSIVGVGTSFIDGVYEVSSVSIAQTAVVGLGITTVAKVTVRVSSYNGLTGIGYSGYYGNYSWGKIVLSSRSKEKSYSAYTLNGYSGISTGTILNRTTPLKYQKYSP